MQKAKVVCVVGSAGFTTLSLAAFMGLVGVIVRYCILSWWVPPAWFWWALWVPAIAGTVGFVLTMQDLYRWYFGKCYRPRAELQP